LPQQPGSRAIEASTTRIGLSQMPSREARCRRRHALRAPSPGERQSRWSRRRATARLEPTCRRSTFAPKRATTPRWS
jgi:hypothetical protein